jgi:hypothetical protein
MIDYKAEAVKIKAQLDNIIHEDVEFIGVEYDILKRLYEGLVESEAMRRYREIDIPSQVLDTDTGELHDVALVR